MFRHLIIPLTKSPNPAKGRWGSIEDQDWYHGVRLAAHIAKNDPLSRILVISDFHVPGCEQDADTYNRALLELGVPASSIEIIRKESETCGQLNLTFKMASRKDSVTIISSFLHWPRVLWLTLGKKCTRRIVFGHPRPKEAFTDIILAFIFPALDLLGLRNFFLRRVLSRRKKGKL